MIYCTYIITIFRYNFNLASCPPLESINPVSFKCNTNGVFKVTVSLLIDETLYFKAARPSCYLRKLIDYVMYVSMWENRPFSTIIRSLNEEKKTVNIFPNSTSTLMCLANFDILKNNPSSSHVHDFPL